MDIWAIGPTAAALSLRSHGFSPSEASRIVALRVRFERGEFRETTRAQKRLEFARWLVEHGRLTEHIDTVESECPAGAAGVPSPAERR
jgi:hypothetical protein